jgi:hypothetical protein
VSGGGKRDISTDGGSYFEGSISPAGDVVGGNKITYLPSPPLPPASGLSKVLMAVGVVCLIVGFIMFAYVPMSLIIQIFGALGTPGPAEPNIRFQVLPWLPLGFGLFFAGIVLTSLGGVARFTSRRASG